jgi:hypothetical protein
MYRSIRIALSAGVILLASAAVPPMLPDSTTMSLSGSALAQKTPTTDSINLNSSRSNVERHKVLDGRAERKPPKNQTGNTTQPGKGQLPAPAEATKLKGTSKTQGDFN